MLSVVMLNVVMMSVIYAECHLCRVSFMLSVNDFRLSVVMLNVVILSVVAPPLGRLPATLANFRQAIKSYFRPTLS